MLTILGAWEIKKMKKITDLLDEPNKRYIQELKRNRGLCGAARLRHLQGLKKLMTWC